MEQNVEYRQQLVREYEKTLIPLLRYLPWLEQSSGKKASTNYTGQDIAAHSISFPVYDGTLMNFVKELSRTDFMDKNYRYIYTRNHIRTAEDERRVIERATLKEWDILKGILSRYVLGGMSKGNLWSEAIEESIFYLVISKMKQIVEYWNRPLDRR